MSEPTTPVVEGAAIDLPETVTALYKDRSGKHRDGAGSEGKANFATVTAEALKVLEQPAE